MLSTPLFALEVLENFESSTFANEIDYTSSETFTIAEYLNGDSKKWETVTDKTPNFGFTNVPHWFRLKVNNNIALEKSFLLTVGNSQNDHVDFFLVKDKKVVDHYQTGDLHPFKDRRIQHRLPIFPVTLKAKSEYELFVRIQTEGALQAPLTLWQPELFWAADQTLVLGRGLYFGTMGIMILYNLFLFATVREKNYLLYVGFVFSATLFELAKSGFGMQYIWPQTLFVNEAVLRMGATFSGLFICLFAMQFLDLKQNLRRINTLFFGFVVFYLVYLGANWMMPYSSVMSLLLLSLLITCILSLYSGCAVWMQGSSYAKYYTLAWTGLLIGTSLGLLSRLGILPRSSLTEYSGQVGMMIEVCLLSFALGDRINQERNAHAQAQIRAREEKVMYEREKVARERVIVRRLQQLDKLKDEFLANTSHELRTPLHGIIGLSESLIDGAAGETSETMKRNLDMIASSGRRLSNLVNDILDFSKLKNKNITLKQKPVDLRACAEVVLRLSQVLVNGKPLLLKNHIPEDIQAVWADEDRLQQILYNLVGNAIKFSDKGAITISAETFEQKIIVRVADTGIGIPLENQSKIFRSFEQIDGGTERSNKGTGLGLTVTQQLVSLHGGILSVDSEPGRGSTFSFPLPLTLETPLDASQPPINTLSDSEPAVDENSTANALPLSESIDSLDEQPHQEVEKPQEIAQIPRAEDENHKEVRILVVDDEAINCQVLCNHLSLRHYDVTVASSGPEALALIEKHAEQRPLPFDLILLDVMMPRMSGYEVCETLREKYPAQELPVLFLTAKNLVADLVIGFKAGGNDFITKPIAKEELLARVKVHSQLLEINRHLETKVRERTQSLHEKHEHLLQTQGQLVQSEKMASLATLVAGMAHEINNPTSMTCASVFSLGKQLNNLKELLLVDNEAAFDREAIELLDKKFATLTSLLQVMHEGTTRIKELVDGFRVFSRLDEGDYQVDSLGNDLDFCIDILKANHSEHVDFQCEMKDNPRFYCHVAQLNQAFMNIITNSCQAIEQKFGRSSDAKGLVTVDAFEDDNHIVIRVHDNGCGMHESVCQRIFEPFFTTRVVGEGTGLGLAIAFGIVEQHKGRIDVDSKEGVGTTLTVYLPLFQAPEHEGE